MQHIRKFRIPALFCALAVLICELISRPYANMGVADDGPYILMVQHLSATGHIVYNGWAAAMLGWQLYLAAAFIKLFGFSFTAIRMSTLLTAMVLAFVLQRCMVRSNISERNATIGTLALVLSPLYLMLSVTFMSDIQGLFAIVICLYGCLRALQASTSRATIAWLCFAVATNAIIGTSRQIAWLGILVMVPSTLWLLRAQRRVFIAGAAATVAGALFILACMHWFSQQPYSIPEPLFVGAFPLARALSALIHAFLDVPLLLLPIVVLFIPQIRKSRPRVLAVLCTVSAAYVLLAIARGRLHPGGLLEPTLGDWVSEYGTILVSLHGTPPIFLNTAVRVLLTILSLGGLLGLITLLVSPRSRTTPPVASSQTISWTQLGVLLLPFATAYFLLLASVAATTGIFDRYLLGLLVVALVYLVRYYQDRVQPGLSIASLVFIGIIAVYSIAITHNMFALYRARVALTAELRSAGIPDTSVDNGWEYNLDVELRHSNHINDPRIVLPANAFVPNLVPPDPKCQIPSFWYNKTPHIHPLYSVSFTPNACYGLAPFAPVHYSRWLASKPGTLYVVRSLPPSKQ